MLKIILGDKNMTLIEKKIQDKGLKKQWIAKKVGIAPYTLSRIVKGESVPELRTAIKLARLLETTVEELWGHLIQ